MPCTAVLLLYALLSRLRLAVAELGKDTADEVTEVATLKANNQDIKWQVRAAWWHGW